MTTRAIVSNRFMYYCKISIVSVMLTKRIMFTVGNVDHYIDKTTKCNSCMWFNVI